MKAKGRAIQHRIVDAANRLFYRQGFNQTSFSDIADAAQIPRGNFYYYFRSKDEILKAIIEQRIGSIRAMLEDWDQQYPAPKQRLKRYVQILLNEEKDVLRYGCPMGSLNVELSKTQLVQQSQAAEMFSIFLDWLKEQFQELGYGRTARDQALHLVARMQGVSLIGNVYKDPRLLRKEAKSLQQWIDGL